MFALVFVTSHMEISFNLTNKLILNQILSQPIFTECIFPSLSIGAAISVAMVVGWYFHLYSISNIIFCKQIV